MKFSPPNAQGRIWVDLTPSEVYAFSACWPDFGPKTRAISLELDPASGDVYEWIGVEESHDRDAIESLGRYAWTLMPRNTTKSRWRLMGDAIFNLFRGEPA